MNIIPWDIINQINDIPWENINMLCEAYFAYQEELELFLNILLN